MPTKTKSSKLFFMTNRKNLWASLAIAAVAIFSVSILSSWDFKDSIFFADAGGNQACDTIPQKNSKEKKIQDLDDVLDELNNADFKVDMQKMKRELDEAMTKIDMQKMKLEIEKALKDVDMEKIKRDVESSIAKIDWEKMQSELERVKEINMDKMQLDMEKMQAELSKIGPEIEKSMEKAKVDIEKSKKEMKEYNDFVDGLEKDGLLNRKEGYNIKHKDGELIINGKKAPDAVYKKYRSFLEKHKTFKIDKSDDDFNIDID